MTAWGRRQAQTSVVLNVYDLSEANELGYSCGLGAYHSGVEIGDREYTFAGGAGIFDTTPRDAPGARFRESITLGTFEGGQGALSRALDELKPFFDPSSYNVITKNCNHFSDALSRQLLDTPIPGWVNRLSNIGNCFSCLIPPQLLGQSPVNAPGGGGGSQAPSFQAFGGGGHSLSNPQNTAGSANGSSSSNELNDRREKIRAATLARMNRGNSGNRE